MAAYYDDNVGFRTRRAFLKSVAATAAGLGLTPPIHLFGEEPVPSGREDLLGGAAQPPIKSRVVEVRDEKLITTGIVQHRLLRSYLRDALCHLTDTYRPEDAWHKILSPEDVILIKFNRSGSDKLGTASVVATEILKSLIAGGWRPEQISCLEHEGSVSRFNTKPADLRWQGQSVRFGRSGEDVFVAALAEATAIINVPFLKTHHLAVMTCCLKNLSHGLIRHPARFHGDGCDPAIGEIAGSDAIKSKLKLNIVNGLRVVYNKGADAGERDIENAGVLIVGRDPIACDAAGYGIINEIRALHALRPLLPELKVPAQFVTAKRFNLGQYDSEFIELIGLPD